MRRPRRRGAGTGWPNVRLVQIAANLYSVYAREADGTEKCVGIFGINDQTFFRCSINGIYLEEGRG